MRSLSGRNRLRTARTAIAITIALLTALTAACFNSNTDCVEGGSLAKSVSLKGATFTVGSKEFTEQRVLCHITSLALRSAGATVREKCGMQGSNLTRAALISGSIDMYTEYTGTAWINHLGHTDPIKDPTQQYNDVAHEDLAKNHVKWLTPSPANDTYAIGVKSSTANKLGVTTISDYAQLVHTDPSDASLCVASEFAVRSDGLPGLEKKYNFTTPRNGLATLAEDDLYDAISKGDPCEFGEITTTDWRVHALNLTVLQDDRDFFPFYNPVLTVRESVYNDHQDLAKIAEPIALALTNEVLRRLNGQVDGDGRDPNQVAQDWLQAKGFIGKVVGCGPG
jgi:osmoprotectant transport system substrate-binding protein